MENLQLPDHIARIKPGEPFSFCCHPGIDCFTDCCRDLELALTPYDVLRLRYATKLNSNELLTTYIIKEQTETDIFPRFYLTMVDDGNASCVFVTKRGCSIYQHRPGACRNYPLGRAVTLEKTGIKDFFVLLHEPHCHGFTEKTIQTVASFSQSQEVASYNRFNDMVVEIQQHERIKKGMRLTKEQADLFTLALYDLDTFKQKIKDGDIRIEGDEPFPDDVKDDEKMLLFAFGWLKSQLFG